MSRLAGSLLFLLELFMDHETLQPPM